MTIHIPSYGIKQYNFQVVLIDMQSSIFESCDSLFSTEKYIGKSLKELCYFFEGELDSILDSNATKITFEKIVLEKKWLPGFYDFIFSKQEFNGQEFVLWEIFDHTIIYQEYAFLQQLQNEIAIHEQHKKKNLGSAKENLEFFQSGYSSIEENNFRGSIIKRIESKFKNTEGIISKPFNSICLDRLKSCVDTLTKEIEYFVRQMRNSITEYVDIKSSITCALDCSAITFAPNIPARVLIDEDLVKKLLQILSYKYPLLPSSSPKNVDVSYNQGLSNKNSVTITLKEDANDTLKSVCTFIRLSVLKCLVNMLEGDLNLALQENGSIFLTKIDIPLK